MQRPHHLSHCKDTTTPPPTPKKVYNLYTISAATPHPHHHSAPIHTPPPRQPIRTSAHLHIHTSTHPHIHTSANTVRYGASPYVLEATPTSVRGRQPRSGPMLFCPFVLMFSALAAAKPRYGASPSAHLHICTSAHLHICIFAHLHPIPPPNT